MSTEQHPSSKRHKLEEAAVVAAEELNKVIASWVSQESHKLGIRAKTRLARQQLEHDHLGLQALLESGLNKEQDWQACLELLGVMTHEQGLDPLSTVQNDALVWSLAQLSLDATRSPDQVTGDVTDDDDLGDPPAQGPSSVVNVERAIAASTLAYPLAGPSSSRLALDDRAAQRGDGAGERRDPAELVSTPEPVSRHARSELHNLPASDETARGAPPFQLSQVQTPSHVSASSNPDAPKVVDKLNSIQKNVQIAAMTKAYRQQLKAKIKQVQHSSDPKDVEARRAIFGWQEGQVAYLDLDESLLSTKKEAPQAGTAQEHRPQAATANVRHHSRLSHLNMQFHVERFKEQGSQCTKPSQTIEQDQIILWTVRKNKKVSGSYMLRWHIDCVQASVWDSVWQIYRTTNEINGYKDLDDGARSHIDQAFARRNGKCSLLNRTHPKHTDSRFVVFYDAQRQEVQLHHREALSRKLPVEDSVPAGSML
ncbi:hypothetical protein ACM66B_004133 [Microbotryomycetes sp. NB124-2]